jgi:hypothetical protein
MKKYAILHIIDGETLYRWNSKKREFEMAYFDNENLAGHAINDFRMSDYWVGGNPLAATLNGVPSFYSRYVQYSVRKRAGSYHHGLFPKEFVDKWYERHPNYKKNKIDPPDASHSWTELGLADKIPTKEKPWPKESFLIIDIEVN